MQCVLSMQCVLVAGALCNVFWWQVLYAMCSVYAMCSGGRCSMQCVLVAGALCNVFWWQVLYAMCSGGRCSMQCVLVAGALCNVFWWQVLYAMCYFIAVYATWWVGGGRVERGGEGRGEAGEDEGRPVRCE